MIRVGLYISLISSVIALGLIAPGGDPKVTRGPVPDSQKVAHSSHCSGCHGVDETAYALVDYAGNDVSIFDDWQISMMAFSTRDPFWKATVAHEVNHYPAAREGIETTCLKCHAPLGSFEARRNGRPYTFEDMVTDSLGLDGVSCSACHQQPAEGLGDSFSGNYDIDTNRLMFGHYPNPFKGPMQIYVGFEPEFSDHIYSSGVCAGCHTLITETLREDGTPSGDYFVEQATYHEWLNSAYPNQGKECQTCHVPFINDGVIIATDLLALEERQPFGLHQFSGANTAMLDLMRTNKDQLNLPVPESSHAWDESIDYNRKNLSRAAELSVTSYYVYGDSLYLTLDLRNKSGHKLPSGYPSRLAWIQITLDDVTTQQRYYSNGALSPDGHIEGRDFPFEPHHQISKSEADVQIYELVMSDLEGQLTTRLNAAHQPLKDNRLLPLGFDRNHVVYDTVAVWGSAKDDPDYNEFSAAGQDNIEYHIPLHGAEGLANLSVSLMYQTLPARWMTDLFTSDTLDLVGQFKSMYQDYRLFTEIIDTVRVDSIDLSSTATSPIASVTAMRLYPNPLSGAILHVVLADHFIPTEGLSYHIASLDGTIVQQGRYNESIEIQSDLAQGLYAFVLFDRQRMIAIRQFVIL